MGVFNLPGALFVGLVSWVASVFLFTRRKGNDVGNALFIMALSSLQFADVILWWVQYHDGLHSCSWLNAWTTGFVIPTFIALAMVISSYQSPVPRPRAWWGFILVTILFNYVFFYGKCSDLAFFDGEEGDAVGGLLWAGEMFNPVLAIFNYIALARPRSLLDNRTWYLENGLVFAILAVGAFLLPYFAHCFFFAATVLSWLYLRETKSEFVVEPTTGPIAELQEEAAAARAGRRRAVASIASKATMAARPKRMVRRARNGEAPPPGSDPASYSPNTYQVQVQEMMCIRPSAAIAQGIKWRNRSHRQRSRQNEIPGFEPMLCYPMKVGLLGTSEPISTPSPPFEPQATDIAQEVAGPSDLVPAAVTETQPSMIEELLGKEGDVQEVVVTADVPGAPGTVDMVPADVVAPPPKDEPVPADAAVVVEQQAVGIPGTSAAIETGTVMEAGKPVETIKIYPENPGQCDVPLTHVLNGSTRGLKKFGRNVNLAGRRVVARRVLPAAPAQQRATATRQQPSRLAALASRLDNRIRTLFQRKK